MCGDYGVCTLPSVKIQKQGDCGLCGVREDCERCADVESLLKLLRLQTVDCGYYGACGDNRDYYGVWRLLKL